MSAESGISTFRDNGGLWEQYNVEDVATPEGWVRNPQLVTDFYNTRRRQLLSVKPCLGHELVAKLEEKHKVVVVTQNVDDLHEKAGSTNVIHLHGELMKVTSSLSPNDPRYIRTLDPGHLDVKIGDLADLLIVIGTSLNVYPAAGLTRCVPSGTPIYLIDPQPVAWNSDAQVHHIMKGASEGMQELMSILNS